MATDPRRCPLFVVIEGIDGSGSTTQGDRLASWLRSQGYRAHFTHEPSGGPAGMLIRLALSKRLRGHGGSYHVEGEELPAASDIDGHTLALLYAADRTDHLATEIQPNLRNGRVVICDRYLMSTIAYQGLTSEEEWLYAINRHAPSPDLCIYLDVPVEHALTRMAGTRWTRDLYEEEDQLHRIRNRYLSLVREARPVFGPIVTIDASKAQDQVAEAIQSTVEPILTGQGSTIGPSRTAALPR